MSNKGPTVHEGDALSPHDTQPTTNNARNRRRTTSGSSSNLEIPPDTALLADIDDINGDIIEGQGYRERVVIMTGQEVEEDSGISEATEDHLLAGTDSRSREVDTGRSEPRKETLWHVAIQVFIPFLIAGFGMMAAGLLLDSVQVVILITVIFG